MCSQIVSVGYLETLEGVSAVAQWVKNPTTIPEDVGSIPGLVHWVTAVV